MVQEKENENTTSVFRDLIIRLYLRLRARVLLITSSKPFNMFHVC